MHLDDAYILWREQLLTAPERDIMLQRFIDTGHVHVLCGELRGESGDALWRELNVQAWQALTEGRCHTAA